MLEAHPASTAAKMEAFAMLNSLAATSVQYELAGGSALQERNIAYLTHALQSGERPGLARLLSQAPPGSEALTAPEAGPDLAEAGPDPAEAGPDPADRYPDVLARVLTGLLGPAKLRT